ncbi:MAG: BlaI/MecI/CopY family transcriptional regulator [Oscillospiraceae bacterium]|jgi:BlaI family penicillinase repressor|nr:BlaI/MecI/CopY family transcriptional regulator [Oscillospiraceae bacterium]MDE6899804.1 BlaI/MecI/CopY family transcriptional regulator [Oscillospiraceae bacterium]
MKKLGDAELEIMLAVWEAGEPVPSSYVQEKLRGRRDWALPSILTSLSRLVDKGFLSCQKRGKSNWYHPLVSEKDYKAAEGRGLIDRLYGGSFTGMVASLCDGRAIDEDDLAQLRRYLDTLEGK